jgi:hypothetical protein
MNYLEIIFWLLLVDSLIANIISWTPKYQKYFMQWKIFKRYFPLTRGWTVAYFVLVLFIGFLIF